MINLIESLENLEKAVKEISEYFVSEEGEPAIILGDVENRTEFFWTIVEEKGEERVFFHIEKEKLWSRFASEILDYRIWETKDFTMFGLYNNETGDCNMIFDNSKKITEEEMENS